MTHLRDDELVRWRDRGEAKDRERVLGHLAACETCRRRLVALVREAPIDTPTSFDPRAFAPRGIEAYDTAARRTRTMWIGLSGLAAAAVVVMAVWLRPAPVAPPADTTEIRSTELQAIAPVGRVSAVSEFRWASPFAAARYRLTIRDSADAVVLTLEMPAERVTLTEDQRARLAPGSYRWLVDAVDASGAVIASSRPAAFDVGQ
jgi:hypothetical protein